MKRFACILALVSSVALLPNSAQASIMVSFPSASSTSTASAGEYFFNPSHTVEETFVGTGLASVDSLDLALDLDVNVLNSGAFVDFDVLLNGVTVGAFTFNEGDALGVYNFGFSFASILGAGTYTIKLQVNNTSLTAKVL